MREGKGTPEMIRVWTAIKEGADAYLARRRVLILPFVGVLVFALFASVWVAAPTHAATEMYGDNARLVIAIGRAIAFIAGRHLLADRRPIGHAHGRAG